MILKAFSCADLFSRPLCWSIFWWIMWFLCGLNILQKKYQYIYRYSDWNMCWQSGKCQGKVREFFSVNPVATLVGDPLSVTADRTDDLYVSSGSDLCLVPYSPHPSSSSLRSDGDNMVIGSIAPVKEEAIHEPTASLLEVGTRQMWHNTQTFELFQCKDVMGIPL